MAIVDVAWASERETYHTIDNLPQGDCVQKLYFHTGVRGNTTKKEVH